MYLKSFNKDCQSSVRSKIPWNPGHGWAKNANLQSRSRSETGQLPIPSLNFSRSCILLQSFLHSWYFCQWYLIRTKFAVIELTRIILHISIFARFCVQFEFIGHQEFFWFRAIYDLIFFLKQNCNFCFTIFTFCINAHQLINFLFICDLWYW